LGVSFGLAHYKKLIWELWYLIGIELMNESENISKVQRVFEQFQDESDRASVILVAAAMDEYLITILKAKLVQVSNEDDPLFDIPYAPMRSFRARIDFAYRLGLISEKLCDALHVVRRIRNEFSHDVFGCNFDNQSVRDRTSNLKDSFGVFFEQLYRDHLEAYPPDAVKFRGMCKEKQHFLICAAIMLTTLSAVSKSEEIQSLNQAEEEWFYRV
jgi:hypothetical protein